jgi:hypothetical protein
MGPQVFPFFLDGETQTSFTKPMLGAWPFNLSKKAQTCEHSRMVTFSNWAGTSPFHQEGRISYFKQ